ncbi:MAG TPA: hypothetical protein VJ203_06160 [Bacteroidales bacterium]|nr:hypothetical protein [Bacteroidales bacterium]
METKYTSRQVIKNLGLGATGFMINPIPLSKQLTCISHGPENIDQHLGETIERFLETTGFKKYRIMKSLINI